MFLLFIVFIILRFILLTQRANLGWDQIDSAWAAKSILVDKHIFMLGPVAKGNSGIYIGPLYFYLISIFYFFTNLNPIASPIFQGILSIVNLLVLFFIVKKMFNLNVAFIACFINTFTLFIMNSDRGQSDFYLIVPTSLVIFYFLYKVITNHAKYIIYLAIAVGLSFHVDFTSVYYPLIILLALPFFPRTKATLKYILISIPVFLLFLVPSIVADITLKHSTPTNLVYLFNNYYHGLHLARIIQLTKDAVISGTELWPFAMLSPTILTPLTFLIYVLFMFVYYKKNKNRNSLLLFYLIGLWIIIPWLIMSTYSGEITDYYYSVSRDLFIFALSYIIYILYIQKVIAAKLVIIVIGLIYAFYNIQLFWHEGNGNFLSVENNVKQAVAHNQLIPYGSHDPNYYVQYVYLRDKKLGIKY